MSARSRLAAVGLRLGLALASVALTLVLAELGLRAWAWSRGLGRSDVGALLKKSQETNEIGGGSTGVFGLVEPSRWPEVVYQVKPGLIGLFHGKPLRTNALGLRSHETTRDKPPGVFRIVGIGDSHMFGWGVANDETYLDLLEHRLNQAAAGGRRFEVLNFATPGYNTVMEVGTFEHRALDFAPDLVILHFVGNDFEAPHFLEPPRGWWPSHWYLADMLRRVASHEVDEEGMPLGEKPMTRRERRRASQAQYANLAGKQHFKEAMARLATLTRERHIPVVFLILGTNNGDRRFATQTARQNGFRVLNAQGAFAERLQATGKEVTPENWTAAFRIPADGHPTALGHQAYADALFAELQAMGIAPGPPPTSR